MGCCKSAPKNDFFGSTHSKRVKALQAREEFAILGLADADVAKLQTQFRAMDMRKTNYVSFDEFFAKLQIEDTRFTRRIFNTFDVDKSNKIDFREFTISLWDFCTLSGGTLAEFIFHVYDKNNNGVIDRKEMTYILEDVYGDAYDESPHARRLASKLKESGGRINLAAFITLAQRHSALLYPAFVLHNKLREKFGGESFWIAYESKRKDMYTEKYIPVERILSHRGNMVEIEKAQHTRQIKIDHLMEKMKKAEEREELRAERKKSLFGTLYMAGAKFVRQVSNVPVSKETEDKQKAFNEQRNVKARRVSFIQHLYDGTRSLRISGKPQSQKKRKRTTKKTYVAPAPSEV